MEDFSWNLVVVVVESATFATERSCLPPMYLQRLPQGVHRNLHASPCGQAPVPFAECEQAERHFVPESEPSDFPLSKTMSLAVVHNV